MKTTHITTALLALLLTAASAAAADFEGRIDMKRTAAKPSMENPNSTVTIFIKNPKMRVDATIDFADKSQKQSQGQPAFTLATIFNEATNESLVIMPDQKMYMVMKNENTGAAATAAAQKAASACKPTGKTATILGYRAEEYACTTSGAYTEIWATKGLGKFRMAKNQNQDKKSQPKPADWETFMDANDLFPLKVAEYKKKGGDLVYTLEVTKIDKSTQPSSLFEPPAGFQKFDISAMMGGLMDSMKANINQAETEAAAEQPATTEPAKETPAQKAKKSLLDRVKKF